ncbi:MAG: DNA polymerase III subunit beta [Candidatus Kerfeldbacteria bacterium]
MKVSCTKENLLAGLSLVSRIASKNLTLPILGNVLLKTENGALSLCATNLEVGVVTRVRGKISEDGAITVNARLLAEFVGLLENDRIELETDGAQLRVVGETSKTTIRGMSADDFPIIPTVPREKGVKISATNLRAGLEQVLFAAAQDATRPEISGTFVSVTGNTMTLAATDSYRLAERHLSIEGRPAELVTIIPTRALFELARTLPTEGEVEAFIGDTQALFVSGSAELTTRLVEGKYPDYGQIIPKTTRTDAHIATDSFIKVVKTASLFVRTGINDISITLDPDRKAVTVSAANAELGEHQGSVPAKIHGDAASIVFNYRYLLDGLAAMSGAETVSLGVSDSASPGILKPLGKEVDYLYLIMPIRQ